MSDTVISIGSDRDRVTVDMSVKSYIVIEKGLRSLMEELGHTALKAEALQDEEVRKAAVGTYHHTKNLLKKFLDGRGLVPGQD